MKYLRVLGALVLYTAFMVLMENLLPWAPMTNAAVTTAALMALAVAFLAGLYVGERKGMEQERKMWERSK